MTLQLGEIPIGGSVWADSAEMTVSDIEITVFSYCEHVSVLQITYCSTAEHINIF